MKKMLTLLTLASATLIGTAQAHEANAVLDNYVAVSTALAQDNLDEAKSAAATLAESAKGTPLAEPATALATSDSLDTARGHFKVISAEAVKLVKGNNDYYVFTCPMAKADWVQKTKETQNPYMGKEMSSCGSLKGPHAMGTLKMGGCCG